MSTLQKEIHDSRYEARLPKEKGDKTSCRSDSGLYEIACQNADSRGVRIKFEREEKIT